MEPSEREAQCKQYRDWLIPATIFVGVSTSLLVLGLSEQPLTWLLVISIATALLSMAFFLLSLLWAFTRLEELESLGSEKEESGSMFVLTLLGIVSLFCSITLFSFWRGFRLGICVVGVFVLFVFLFWFFLKETDLFEK